MNKEKIPYKYKKKFSQRFIRVKPENYGKKVKERKLERISHDLLNFLKTTKFVIKNFDTEKIIRTRLLYPEDIKIIMIYYRNRII